MSLQSLARRLGAIALAALGAASAHAFFIGPPPLLGVEVREYVNDFTGHYVLLSDPREIQGVEGGAAGPGWRFTGYEFGAYQLAEMREGGDTAVPVCRFYAPAPVNSHFYTADAAECDFLRTHDTGWVFEKVDFKVNVPGAGGACAASLAPIWRAYNNRFAQNDSNHRYGGDARVRGQMLSAGWIDEGTAFCARYSDRAIQQGYWLSGTGKAPSADCGLSLAGATQCVALRGLPAMEARLEKWIAPAYNTITPEYTPDFVPVTGWLPHLETVYAPAFTSNHTADARRSFVQDVGSGPIGIHLNGADRTSGDYASISPTYPIAGQTIALQTNIHVFPWAPPHVDRDMWIATQMAVKTVRRADASSHVYGHPLIDFRDAASGHHLWVTLQAFGTNAPNDFVGHDVATGTAIVSTVFRADPLFGTRLAGDYNFCVADAQGGSCPQSGIDYSFRIDGDDFKKVVALARDVDPALSPDIGQYEVIGFQLHVEAYRDADAGLVVNLPSLTLSY
jgi:hypothetical protein